MPSLSCEDCPGRSICTKLCQEVEKIVGSDHVSLRESTKPEWLIELIRLHSKNPHSYQEIKDSRTASNLNFKFLSPIQNKILYLFYFEGLSYAEIARNLKIDKRKVEYCIYYGKKRISVFFADIKRKEN